MTTQFQVGQEYKINAVESITVTRRSDVSVWFSRNGKEFRRKIQVSGYGENTQEFVNYEDRSLYAVKSQVSVNDAETIETNVNAETNAKFSDTHTIIVESLEPIKDVEYAEICHAFDLNDGECFLSFGEVYSYSKPFSFTNDGIYYVPYETLNGRSGGSYKVKVSAKVEPQVSVKADTIETPSVNLNTLEISTSENLETLEFPQGSTHELDLFEVVYQIAESEDEICYESRKVYANSKNHAKSIVSQSLQTQNLRFCIIGCEYALVIEDLSDFSLVDEF